MTFLQRRCHFRFPVIDFDCFIKVKFQMNYLNSIFWEKLQTSEEWNLMGGAIDSGPADDQPVGWRYGMPDRPDR
jgi:hypothetical protein